MEIETREGWRAEVIVVQPPTGRLRFLVNVRRRRCPCCSTGFRTVSVWGTVTGFMEEVAWCCHCFNATCRALPLGEREPERFAAARAAFLAQPRAPVWEAVRPALEDLERRRLL